MKDEVYDRKRELRLICVFSVFQYRASFLAFAGLRVKLQATLISNLLHSYVVANLMFCDTKLIISVSWLADWLRSCYLFNVCVVVLVS